MEQDFDGGLERRGGTAPIAREQPKRGVGGASSPYFTSPSRSSLGGNAAITSSPIRSKPQPVRPKTSSTFDLSDLNMAFRANRSVGLAAATQQQDQTLSSTSSAGTTSSSSAPAAHLGSDNGEGSAFRRLLHPNDYLATTTAAADDDNPAARNAWGNGRQQPSFNTRGMTEKDFSNRQPPPKKSSLSAYLQQPSYAQSRSSRGTTPSSSQRPRNPPGATQSLGETQQGGAGAWSGVKPAATKKAGVPLFGSLGNSASTAASAGGGLKKTGSTAALTPSSQQSQPQQQAPPGTAPGDALGGSKARGDQVALDQSAAIAYLGGTPPVLRSSTTRSRMRLHVNVAKAAGGGDDDDDDHVASSSGVGAGGRGGPGPHREQLLVTRPTTDGGIINLVPGTRAAAATKAMIQSQPQSRGVYGYNADDVGVDDDDDEAVEVVEELEEPLEPSPKLPPQRASSLRASMPASSSSSPRERQRSPVSLVAPSVAVTALPDASKAGPRSSPLSNVGVRGVEEAVVYIGHHDIGEANRKLERPTSRKPYLGAAAARGEAKGQPASSSSSLSPASAPAKREAHSAGARPAASSVPPAPTGLMLKRTNSFGSAVFRDAKQPEQQRPPSRQSSAFPVHLAEPLSSSSGDAAARTTTMTSSGGAAQEWDDDWEPPILGGGKGDAERSKLKTRQSGQPVDLDDLDSDDEIFQKRYNKRGGGSPVRDWAAVGNSGGIANSNGNSSGTVAVGVAAGPKAGIGGVSALVQPLTLNASSSSSSLASGASTSARRDPVSARRGSLSARRGSDPVADGFAALGSHDDGKWPFSITVNYGDGSAGGAVAATAAGAGGGSQQHTPRHIAEMERRRGGGVGQGSAADDDLPDDLSEFDLDLDVGAASPRSAQGSGWPGRTNGASPSNSINNNNSNNNSNSGSRSRKNSAARSRTNSASHSRSSAKLAYASEDAAVASKANHTVAASPTFSNLGVYDDDGDDANYDSDEESIITENEGFEGSHGNFNLESSLPEDFLNLFSVV